MYLNQVNLRVVKVFYNCDLGVLTEPLSDPVHVAAIRSIKFGFRSHNYSQGRRRCLAFGFSQTDICILWKLKMLNVKRNQTTSIIWQPAIKGMGQNLKSKYCRGLQHSHTAIIKAGSIMLDNTEQAKIDKANKLDSRKRRKGKVFIDMASKQQ